MIMILFAIIFAYGIVTIAARCFAEWFVARFFLYDNEYSKMILLTNGIAWTVLWISTFSPLLLPSFINAWMSFENLIARTVITEIIVFVCKYFIYDKRMIEYSGKECLRYTAVASAVSLLVSFLIAVLSTVAILALI